MALLMQEELMKYSGTLLAVHDINRARQFYETLFGCEVGMDLGVHVSFRNGISLQQEHSWLEFIHRDRSALTYGANDMELYFETNELDAFLERLHESGAVLVHPALEHSWGQRVVRFYDPDGHIIEVGEDMGDVARRFLAAGMTREQAARRMDVPLEMIAVFLCE